jgi:pimeloyl-ACP methyl ester carboxylesterase
MPALAQYFEVVAVDQRGIGLSGTPGAGTTPAPSSATWSR